VKLGLPSQRAKQEQILRVSENRVLRTVKGHEEEEEGTGGCRKWNNDSFLFCALTKYYYSIYDKPTNALFR
jgi:hypothetical protein